MTAKPTYAELEQRIRILEEKIASKGARTAVDAAGDAVKDGKGDVDDPTGVHTDITERRLEEKALRESEQKFRMMSEQSLLAVGFIQDGLFRYANQAYCDISGYSIDEIMNWKPYEYAKVVHPDDHAFVMEQARKKQAGAPDTVVHYQFKGLTKSGETKWLELYSKTVLYQQKNADLVMFIDITERKRAEEQLQRYNQRLMILHQIDQDISLARSAEEIGNAVLKHIRGLVSCSMASVVLYEPDTDELVILSRETSDGTKMQPGMRVPAPEGWVSRMSAEKCHLVEDVNALAEPVSPVARLAMEEGVRSYLAASMMVEGNLIGELILSGRTLSAFSAEDREIAGKVADQLAIAIHQVRMKEQIERHAAELEEKVAQRTAELQDINAELQAFTYSVSHDLKAPLRGIDGYSLILLQDYADKLDEEGRRFLHTIRGATQQMNQLIDDLLAYSRLERRTMKTGKLNPRSLVEMVLVERADELRRRQVVLSVDIPCVTVTAEIEGLSQALRNLLENALKFSRGIPAPRIEIGGRETDRACILWVRDNGIGFDMQYHDRIFEIFQRLHRAEDYPGTGVGLALVRKVMQRMGGRVWGDGTPGHGATFYLEVPK